MVDPAAPSVLIAEDDDAHAQLIEAAFASSSVRVRLERVCDGEQALARLGLPLDASQDTPADAATPPRLVLVDLKLPRLDGFEVLRRIKAAPRLLGTPVVVLSTSGSESDRRRAFEAGANSYLVKPTDFDAFCAMLDAAAAYWLTWDRFAGDDPR
ncbi:MAG: response regulator [Planctomycetota bacterium]